MNRRCSVSIWQLMENLFLIKHCMALSLCRDFQVMVYTTPPPLDIDTSRILVKMAVVAVFPISVGQKIHLFITINQLLLTDRREILQILLFSNKLYNVLYLAPAGCMDVSEYIPSASLAQAKCR